MRPRLGFAGLGWIGRHRLAAIAEAGVAEIVALADPDAGALAHARAVAPGAAAFDDPAALLDQRLDGVVIATPSAMHAAGCLAMLDAGLAVFCQKPLARTGDEAASIVAAARHAGRRLDVDFSYRHAAAFAAVRDLARTGALGEVYAADLTFHNAYGPDKAWFYEARLSGGGCMMDLGVHLLDQVAWTFDAEVVGVDAHLCAAGRPLATTGDVLEDYGVATLTLASGAVVRLACSWRLPIGRDAQIEVALRGTRGGAACRNVAGSFYDFVAERYDGTRTVTLVEPPDAWGGRAAVAWATALAAGAGFDPAIESAVATARVLDRIYGRIPVTVP
jgi:predicted dehydrogenase